MRRSVVTHHRRRIKDLSFNDRSNLAGQVAGYRTLFLKYRGATILGRLRTSRFLNESVYARASEIANKRPRFLRGQFQGKMEAIRRKASGGRSHILAS
jgi:hypothetical protein